MDATLLDALEGFDDNLDAVAVDAAAFEGGGDDDDAATALDPAAAPAAVVARIETMFGAYVDALLAGKLPTLSLVRRGGKGGFDSIDLVPPPPNLGQPRTPPPITIFSLSLSQGAVLAVRTPAGPPDPAWVILNGAGTLIGRSQRRPTARDLEDAFYNAAAAASPLTKGAAALKGLADAVKGKKK